MHNLPATQTQVSDGTLKFLAVDKNSGATYEAEKETLIQGLAAVSMTTPSGAKLTRTYVSSSTAPGVDDDLDLGFRAGDLWLRVSTGKLYVAVSVADGAADWQILN